MECHLDDMYDVSTWRLVASQGSGGASPMECPVDDMYDVNTGVLLLHRGVVGHPLWLNGLTHCQRVDNGVSPWMLCMAVSTWRLVASQGSGGASPMAEWSYPLPESR